MLSCEHITRMDEFPELLAEAVGDAVVIEAVDIGGGDILAVTPSATHLYRSEGLLSDESVETYSHDIDRLGIDSGRRKSSILLSNIDTERSFTIPSKVADEVVEAILVGVLLTSGVITPEETIEARFRFSDLTLVVTDQQLLKHIGGAVWDEEYEAVAYESLTGLEFEAGSVATQVVLEANGRQQRVKVPNDHAGRVREAIQRTVFEYYGVSSLGGLNAAIAPEEEPEPEDAADSEPDSKAEAATDSDEPAESAGGVAWSPPANQDPTGPRGRFRRSADDAESGTDAGADGEAASKAEQRDPSAETAGDGSLSADDIDALTQQMEALSEQVERQAELLESQQETIEQLVDELRRGR